MHDIIIIGGGPAGLTSAVYALRAGKTALIIEKNSFGGQVNWSPRVENYPAMMSVAGAEIGEAMLNQAMEQGADVELEEVVSIEKNGGLFKAVCESGAEFEGRSVIIATGAKPRTLNLPGEEELTGNGICYCAVCDGAFFKGKTVAVTGGGNSALQDALLLSEKCEKVYLIHRRDSFRGEARLVKSLENKGNVEFLLNSSITGLVGQKSLEAIEIERNGEKNTIRVSGLFVAVGHVPDNKAFSSLIEFDDGGYAASGEDCITVTPGIFVAGDCRAKKVRQITTACADGAVAALTACSFVDNV